MCGIVAAAARRNVVPLLIEGSVSYTHLTLPTNSLV